MKKNKTMRLAACLLVMVLLTTSMISGTFAKYTSSASGSDSARVAKWDIEVNGNKLGVENKTVSFDLFTTAVNDTGNTSDDLNVKNGTDESIIAPGTSGSFKFEIKNLSEVDAVYTIKLTETNNENIPIQYSIDGTNWKDSVAELNMDALTNKNIAMGNGAATVEIQWRWVFEGTTEGAHAGQTDKTDTELGLLGNATVMITAEIVVTQVD